MLLAGAEYWDGETEAHQNLAYFVDPYVRAQLGFGEDDKRDPVDYRQRLKEYCSRGTPDQVIDRTFGNWFDLLTAISQIEELAARCDPRRVSSYPQLINRVLDALGFSETERPFSLRKARQRLTDVLASLRRPVSGDDLEELLDSAWSVCTRSEVALDYLCRFYGCAIWGADYRNVIAPLLKTSEDPRLHDGFVIRSHMLYGNWVSLLLEINRFVGEDNPSGTKAKCQALFGREAILPGDWKPALRLVETVRDVLTHHRAPGPDRGLPEARWQQVWAVIEPNLDPSQRNHLALERLNLQKGKIVLTNLQQKMVAIPALAYLDRFYEQLVTDNIFPKIVVHERAEMDSKGQLTVFFSDEDGNPESISFEPGQVTNIFDVFCPHPTCPQAFYYYDEANRRLPGGPIIFSIWERAA